MAAVGHEAKWVFKITEAEANQSFQLYDTTEVFHVRNSVFNILNITEGHLMIPGSYSCIAMGQWNHTTISKSTEYLYTNTWTDRAEGNFFPAADPAISSSTDYKTVGYTVEY